MRLATLPALLQMEAHMQDALVLAAHAVQLESALPSRAARRCLMRLDSLPCSVERAVAVLLMLALVPRLLLRLRFAQKSQQLCL